MRNAVGFGAWNKVFQKLEASFMDDSLRGIRIISDHFEASTSGTDSLPEKTTPVSHTRNDCTSRSSSNSRLWTRRKLRTAASMLNFLSVSRLLWTTSSDGQEKVVLTAAEIESLRSGLAYEEEREAYLKAQLEHIDEILRSACLTGYLYIRSRWEALPGEPPPIDDMDVDDWLPRFLVLHGSCIFFYLSSTDLGPQDSTLLCDVSEVGPLPSIEREEDGETWYCFYILTRQGLRYECSNASKVQVDSWLMALRNECKLAAASSPDDSKQQVTS